MDAWILARWLAVGAGVVIVAFAVGFAFGMFDSGGVLAQERSPVSPKSITDGQTVVITDDTIPDSMINQVQVHIIKEEISVDLLEPATNVGSTVKTETGDYLYLPMIDRYYSLPADVELVKRIDFGTCNLFSPRCPVMPLYIFQRGEAKVSIDSVGYVSGLDEGDAATFWFFTGAEAEASE